MNEEEFMHFADALTKYLEMQKIFIQNPLRMAEVNAATEIACRLFPEANINIEDDPLQMGAVILSIDDFDLAVRETELFAEMISKADNFEIYPHGEENVKLAILFNRALTRIAP